MRLLLNLKETIEEHFGINVGECEEPQFLRYRTGDFFVAHQDGNTPLIFDDQDYVKSQSSSSSVGSRRSHARDLRRRVARPSRAEF